jgi:DNA-directed RNA polymerase subunit RPC12/RpoP
VSAEDTFVLKFHCHTCARNFESTEAEVSGRDAVWCPTCASPYTSLRNENAYERYLIDLAAARRKVKESGINTGPSQGGSGPQSEETQKC